MKLRCQAKSLAMCSVHTNYMSNTSQHGRLTQFYSWAVKPNCN